MREMRQCKRLLAAVLIVVLSAAFGITVRATEGPGSPVKRDSPLRMEKAIQKN